MAEKFEETYPETVPALNSIKLKTADGTQIINSLTKDNSNEPTIEKSQDKLMEEQGFAMVGRKGHSFPMIEPDPVEEQKKKIMEQQGLVKPENRAGSAAGRNVLVNNPNNPQPATKVSANAYGREQMFNEMASNPGQPYPDPATTPPAPIFPGQQGSFAAYANPAKISEDLNAVDVDAEGGLKGMMAKFKEKRKEKKIEKETKVGEPVSPKPPKLKKPLFKEPKVSENPPQGNPMYGGLTDEFKREKLTGVKAPALHEKHTQISKANVNAAIRDNAAHISYLKRDINYDNRYGGSDKNMTADEKHISKLAGDIKYDVKKKRKYDNV